MEDHGWIDRNERLPGEGDADEMGCICVWHEYQGMMITGWHQMQRNSMMTHWQRTLPPPLEHQMRRKAKK